MGHVQPFVAIILGEGPQEDAEQLARAAGATAILRPGQPHPVPLASPETVIDLAAPGPDGELGAAVIDLATGDDRARSAPDAVIDLIAPEHSQQPHPVSMPAAAVVFDPAGVLDPGVFDRAGLLGVPALVAAVRVLLDRLTQAEVSSPGACVAGGRLLAGPLDLLSSWAQKLAGTALAGTELAPGERGRAGVPALVEALIEHGVEVRAVEV